MINNPISIDSLASFLDLSELEEEIIRIRRALHQIPEIGLFLPKTQDFIIEELSNLDIPYYYSEKDSGILAVIEGAYPGKTIALRADMDALPIQEENYLDYISEHEGIMHACGHDAHVAMLLGAARILSTQRDNMHGCVKLIFQTAEEISRGAEIAIENGFLNDTDCIFGMHIGTLLGRDIPSGTFIVPPACCMASFDKFILRITGKSCHGSSPEKGIDPINIAAHIILSLQAIQTRELAGTESSVLTFGQIHGGAQYNAIPDCVVLEGTTRAVDDKTRYYLANRIEEIASATAKLFGGTCECEFIWGASPVINHTDMADFAAQSIQALFPNASVITTLQNPTMAGEDFANYLHLVPGAFFFLSSANSEKGTDYPHHNSHFDVDEDVLWMGAAAFAAISLNYLSL